MGYKSTKEQVRLATVGVTDRSFLRRIFSSNLSKFCAVATQVDRCTLEDKDNQSKIKEWLNEYFSKQGVFKKGVFDTKIVAAVSSTQKIKKEKEDEVVGYKAAKGFMRDPNKSFSEDNRLISKEPYIPMPVPSVAEAKKNDYKEYLWRTPFPYFPADGNFLNYGLDGIAALMFDLD